MAGDKFLFNNAGTIKEKVAVQVSAGAANAGNIPALDSSGRLGLSLMPPALPATIITQDLTHEFISETDRVNWNNKPFDWQSYLVNEGNWHQELFWHGPHYTAGNYRSGNILQNYRCYFFPVVMPKTFKLSDLAVKVVTGDHGATCTMAFYDGKKRGIGNLVYATNILTCDASGTIVHQPCDLILPPGLYWMGVAFEEMNLNALFVNSISAAAMSNLLGIDTNIGLASFSYATMDDISYGSWPANLEDRTGELRTGSCPAMYYRFLYEGQY